MPLPELIEIIPPTAPIKARVVIPGSKSVTNRALVLAALSQGRTKLTGALWSEDTQVMVQCLQTLGFMVEVSTEPDESSNRTIVVIGLGGAIPASPQTGTIDLFVGNAGTAARFLAAMVCLGQGVYRLHGVPRMHQRPQAELFQALRQLGYIIETEDDHLPAIIHGGGPKPGARCSVNTQSSSQFASALLLSAEMGGWTVEMEGYNPDESPYVEMTAALAAHFPKNGGTFAVEPDASSGSYFVAASNLLAPYSQIEIPNWPVSGWQIDAEFPRYLPLRDSLSRKNQLGDAIMTAIAMAPLAAEPTRFTDLGRLRVQECERVEALRTELTKCGAQVVETGDTLEIKPGPVHGAEIETYNDHRMAMCFATLALIVPGMRIRNAACVRKTFPNFFVKLSTPPPHGLGVQILDAVSRRVLTAAELSANETESH